MKFASLEDRWRKKIRKIENQEFSARHAHLLSKNFHTEIIHFMEQSEEEKIRYKLQPLVTDFNHALGIAVSQYEKNYPRWYSKLTSLIFSYKVDLPK